jgi:tetratricopeptide (TPR) repeat protein
MKVAGLKRVSCVVIAATALSGLPPAIPGATQLPVAVQDDSADSHPRFDLSRLELNPARRVEVEAALAKRDYKQAETILVEEVERDPKSFRAANLLEFAGGIFFLDGQFLNAAIAWKKAEALAPLSEPSRFTLAMAYVKLERPQWARPELESLAASHPRNALYLYWLARLDYDSQKYTDAVSLLQRVTALDPKMSRAYDLLGLCYDYLGRLDEAITEFARAVELNGSQTVPSPWPHLDMAISQIELGQLAEAEANLRQAIRYDSRLPQAQYQLGRVLDKEEKTQEAVDVLKASAALNPEYPEPHYLLGRIYQKLGRGELAKAEVEKFQQLQKTRPQPAAMKSSPLN